jgi:hypothetical protein
MKISIVVCFCLTSLIAFSQDVKFKFNLNKLDTTNSGLIKVIKKNTSGELTLQFENVSPKRLFDTLAKYDNVKIKYENKIIPPLTCEGEVDLNGNPFNLLNAVCSSYNWELSTKNKKSFIIKNKNISLQELESNFTYKTEIDPNNRYIDTKYDTLRKIFVLFFKGVSPYDLFKKQAEFNGYKILFTDPLKPLSTISGIMPLFLEESILIEHFCKVHNLYQFEDEETNKHVISQTLPKK